MFLQGHFGDVSKPQTQMVEADEDELFVMDVKLDGVVARIDLISMVSALYIPTGLIGVSVWTASLKISGKEWSQSSSSQ